jgi:Icc protein
MRLAWLTDIHLNFLPPPRIETFLATVREGADGGPPDAVVITGDIAEARDLLPQLRGIEDGLPCPIYFVLGNHDFYFGSIAQVRDDARRLCQSSARLVYLTQADVVELTPGWGLVGHDGWADARLGDYERSLVMMNDYRLIGELAGVDKRERLPLLHALGDEAAAHIRRVLPAALARFPQVLLATHVPPFREACWHQGQWSNDEWLPHFSCLAMGRALMEIMSRHPDRKLTVLCGHTHGEGEWQMLDNLRVLTGGAEYGHPAVQRIFELE